MQVAQREKRMWCLTVPWQMVRNPFFTEHFLFCHTFLSLRMKYNLVKTRMAVLIFIYYSVPVRPTNQHETSEWLQTLHVEHQDTVMLTC